MASATDNPLVCVITTYLSMRRLDALAVDNNASEPGLTHLQLSPDPALDRNHEWSETENGALAFGTTSKPSAMDRSEPAASPLSASDVRGGPAEGRPFPPKGLEPVWEHGFLPPSLDPKQFLGTMDPA